MKITHSDAAALIKRGRDGRKKLQNNTYLEQRGADFAVRLHATDIITIHADGTYTLNTGGWDTVTTKDRINGYGPARVWSERGDWYIPSADDPRTPPKIQKCRGCKGTGQRHQAAQYAYGEYREVQRNGEHIPGLGSTYTGHEYVRFESPRLISEAHDYECYSCNGTGQQDYGSKSMPVLFFGGIRVDGNGNVINADGLERLREPAEVKAARIAAEQAAALKRLRNAKRTWLAERKVKTDKGVVFMYKAVGDNYYSAHGALYMPGSVVTADDYRPSHSCGAGLHFSPTVDEARAYDHEATRFLLCAVDRATLITIGGDKAKARSCKVIREVDAEGNPLPKPDPITWASPGYRE